jgi:hypothetical protein
VTFSNTLYKPPHALLSTTVQNNISQPYGQYTHCACTNGLNATAHNVISPVNTCFVAMLIKLNPNEPTQYYAFGEQTPSKLTATALGTTHHQSLVPFPQNIGARARTHANTPFLEKEIKL